MSKSGGKLIHFCQLEPIQCLKKMVKKDRVVILQVGGNDISWNESNGRAIALQVYGLVSRIWSVCGCVVLISLLFPRFAGKYIPNQRAEKTYNDNVSEANGVETISSAIWWWYRILQTPRVHKPGGQYVHP